MKSKTTTRKRRTAGREYFKRNGRRMVTLDEREPLLPDPLPNGNYPAREYMLASMARKIMRHRRRVGLTRVELAKRAGIRTETLCRIEQGDRTPAIVTVEKIDRALRAAEKT